MTQEEMDRINRQTMERIVQASIIDRRKAMWETWLHGRFSGEGAVQRRKEIEERREYEETMTGALIKNMTRVL